MQQIASRASARVGRRAEENDMRQTGPIIGSFVALTLTAAGARAEMSVCNDFQAPIRLALAYEDQGRFVASGWWRAAPGACARVDFAYSGATLYYTADSDSYRDGRFTKRDHWGNKLKLYVETKDFRTVDAAAKRRGAQPAMFSSTSFNAPPPGKTANITFRFKSGGTTIEMKPSP
jgi:uncharacterized membrane protein